MSDAHDVGPRVEPTDVLVDELGRISRGLDAGGGSDELRHRRI
jgi:hypothetical protein